ncbi:universal stress protein [Gleimia hominis]|uniref:Universal stress protein n=1 Tax=Gleimia hominis TaxID=595468 RepID=A0ABU3IBI6_9ACTO|nr:universal stress protein [Gleimia hominis]MDT3767747.1 universal stress protein [Gleimia hominis]
MSVLISYHGNAESDAALKLALQLAQLRRTHLVIVVAARFSKGDERTVSNAHDRLWEALEGTTIPFKVISATADKTVSESVLDTAVETDVDLIVLGLRRGGSKHTYMGDNATRILLDAPCPVVTTTEHVLEDE